MPGHVLPILLLLFDLIGSCTYAGFIPKRLIQSVGESTRSFTASRLYIASGLFYIVGQREWEDCLYPRYFSLPLVWGAHRCVY